MKGGLARAIVGLERGMEPTTFCLPCGIFELSAVELMGTQKEHPPLGHPPLDKRAPHGGVLEWAARKSQTFSQVHTFGGGVTACVPCAAAHPIHCILLPRLGLFFWAAGPLTKSSTNFLWLHNAVFTSTTSNDLHFTWHNGIIAMVWLICPLVHSPSSQALGQSAFLSDSWLCRSMLDCFSIPSVVHCVSCNDWQCHPAMGATETQSCALLLLPPLPSSRNHHMFPGNAIVAPHWPFTQSMKHFC